MTILVVEDNVTNLALIKTILERGGHAVHTARTGQEMRSSLRTLVPDVIVMDLGLPDADGLTLVEELRAARTTATIPVLVLTASATPNEEARAWQAGSSGFMRKPFGAAALLAEIERLAQR